MLKYDNSKMKGFFWLIGINVMLSFLLLRSI